jgi:dihydroneopterin aldolase
VHDRFTESDRRVVALADEEARSLGHNYIGTEHLLLGLLGEQERVAVRVLKALSIATDRMREQVVRIVGDEAGIGDRRPLTPRACGALGIASEEELRLGHDHAGTGHVLLGLVGESEGIAALFLCRLGAESERIRREVVRAPGDGLREMTLGGTEPAIDPSGTATFRVRIEGLMNQARCGVTHEERAIPQPLRVELRYLNDGSDSEGLDRTVDSGVVIEEAPDLLERKEFQLLEARAQTVRAPVLSRFPSVGEVTVTIFKPRVSVDREVSGVSVEATFSR